MWRGGEFISDLLSPYNVRRGSDKRTHAGIAQLITQTDHYHDEGSDTGSYQVKTKFGDKTRVDDGWRPLRTTIDSASTATLG